MHLDLASFPVEQLAFSDRTHYRDGRLSINRKQLRALLTEEPSIADVELALVHPGDETRIVHVWDAIEPRCKVEGRGRIFPGFLGSPDTVGSGCTHRLRGMALLTTGQPPNPVTGLLQPREAIVDMSGPAAPYSPFSETANVVITFHPAADIENEEFDKAQRLASLRAAEYLALTTAELQAPEQRTFSIEESHSDLPRIVYLYQAQSQGIYARTFLYGKSIEDMVPTLIHPNETMDGALVSGNYVYGCFKNPTYLHCNNPVIDQLYREQGRSLNFAGVVLYRGHNYTQAEKQRAANYAAKLAQFLDADGVILTGEGGGNSAIDMMLALQECERLGIKTTVITYELGGPEGQDFPLVHGVPEAQAIVSTGSVDKTLALPTMDTVIGGDRFLDNGLLAGQARELSYDYLYCVANQLGTGRMRARSY